MRPLFINTLPMATALTLTPLFFLIAVLYSMVGLGGGSSYIAVMILCDIPKDNIPTIALCCNIIVASAAFLNFYKAKHFHPRLFWPFCITSLPFAYIGGRLPISEKNFAIIVAVALAITAGRLLFWKPKVPHRTYTQGSMNTLICLLIGAVLGFLAGITGIGGGIYLIPILIIFGFASPLQASALASLFIVINSIAGLAGQLSRLPIEWHLLPLLALAVLIGGIVGSHIGSTKLKGPALQKITALVMLAATIKLIAKL